MAVTTSAKPVHRHGLMEFHDNKIVVRDDCFKDQGGLDRKLTELLPLGLFNDIGEGEVGAFMGSLHAELEAMDNERYLPRVKLKQIFKNTGFSFEKHYGVARDKNREITRNYLEGVESIAVNSGLIHIKKNNPREFEKGVDKMKAIVEESEKTGKPETFDIVRSVYWGFKIEDGCPEEDD